LKLDIELTVERRLGDPRIKIIIDDYLTLASGPAQDHYSFNVNIPDESHNLKIIHYGKTVTDHVLDDQGKILIDKHVEIKSIAMDDIKLNKELWTGKFFPVYMHKSKDEPYFICPNLYLGHNGTWLLDFATPVTNWLINLRRPGPKLDGTIFKSNKEILDTAKSHFQNLPDV
jgi:hypothetical protein